MSSEEGHEAVPVTGLPPGKRYRCGACGNLTRFDIVTTERVVRYWHADLAGDGSVEQEERQAVEVESVTCRWCGSADGIEVVAIPAAARDEPSPTRPAE